MYRYLSNLLVALLFGVLFAGTVAAQSIHVEWGYSPPSEPAVTGFKLYQEGVAVCTSADPNATAMDCNVTLTATTTNFTLTATFNDATESPHSAPFAFTSTDTGQDGGSGGVTPPLQAAIQATPVTGTAPLSVSFSATSSTGTITQYQWDFADGTTASTATVDHQYRTAGKFIAILTIFDATGATSSSTVEVNVTAPEAPVTIPLQAAIQATPVTGTAPLSVNFSAASSTGTISQYQWDFADGSTASTATVAHEYTTAGKFIATLTIHDATGASSSSTVEVNVTAPEAPAPPEIINIEPTVVISTSTSAVGPAPLAMSFDGSASRANGSASITNYAWSFGDGSTTTGATATHTYTTAGTYEATLTVTDSNGLTGSVSTPVVVTAAVVNKAPTAAICTTTASESSPLTVTFDGSCSADTDGSISAYLWFFGDGSVGSGKVVTHTYASAAEFAVTLQVTDDKGATGTAATKIITKDTTASSLNIETGEVSVNGSWVHVTLTNTFENPIVIAGAPSANDVAPGVIRLRNVTGAGFDIKFAEWDYLDGVHASETVSYIVMEKGHHTLPNGSQVEAGSLMGTTSFATVKFSKAFSKIPVVLTSITSTNESDTISGRIKNISTTAFAYAFREQEKNKNTHLKETVSYIAWEPGSGTIDALHYRVANTAKKVTQAWYPVTFAPAHTDAPLVLADMQTTANTDSCSLRIQKVLSSGFTVKVQEEQSKDLETSHAAETVGYISVSQD